jgi:Recombination endonuclease VII
MKKKCANCKKFKLLDDFHKHKGRKLGRTEHCKSCRNYLIVTKRYKLAPNELTNMYKLQGNACKICKKADTGKWKKLSIDHCHKSGKIRGLLCTNCNQGIGKFKDNIEILEKVIKYLKGEDI